MWVTYLHEFDRRPKQFIYFSSIYVSPVVEARDVVSPMLARTTSLIRCPYFLRAPNGEDEEESG